MKLRVKNWRTFQHYKDRNPPWIKLHFALLSSADWVTLDDASRVLAVACMLVASKNEGEIDASPRGAEYLKRVAYLNTKPNFKPLIECGFLESASGLQADASAVQAIARPETETETQIPTEKKSPRAAKAAKRPLPQDFSISERVKEWATSKGFDRLEEHLEAFRRKCSANSYAYADWDSAFMEAVREDWAKLRLGKQTYDFSKMDI